MCMSPAHRIEISAEGKRDAPRRAEVGALTAGRTEMPTTPSDRIDLYRALIAQNVFEEDHSEAAFARWQQGYGGSIQLIRTRSAERAI